MILKNGHYVEVLGEGTPVFFIHPPHMGHVVFKYQRELSRSCKVILYDMRGHGHSDVLYEPVTVPLLVNDIISILDELNIKQVVLCGYSSGGQIAQDFAITHPERTQGLILCGGFSEVNTFWLAQEFRAGIFITATKMQHFLSKVLAKSHRITKQDEEELYEHAMKTHVDTAKQLYEEGLHFCCTDQLSKIKSPVTLVYGKRDYYIHAYIKTYLEQIPHAKPIWIEKAGHQIPTKHHQALNHIIESSVPGTSVPGTEVPDT